MKPLEMSLYNFCHTCIKTKTYVYKKKGFFIATYSYLASLSASHLIIKAAPGIQINPANK